MNLLDPTFDRRTGIGASEVAAALGKSPYQTPYELWELKTARKPPFAGNRFTAWGNRLEQIVAEAYAEEHNVQLGIGVSQKSPEHDWLFATPDRYVFDEANVIAGLVQIKTVDKDAFRSSPEWNDGPDDFPYHYRLQCQTELICNPTARWNDLAVLIGGNQFKTYRIYPDADLQTAILYGTEQFWEYVTSDTPPPATTLADARVRYPLPNGEIVNGGIAALETIHQIRDLTAKRAEIEKALETLKGQICAMMGTAEAITDDAGRVLATWKLVERKGYSVEPSSSRVPQVKK